MIREQFKIAEKEYDSSFDGFLQFLGTISRHDDKRAALHVSSKIWMFYRLNEIDMFKPKIWICSKDGTYLVNDTFVNISPVKSAGRLIIDLDAIPEQFIGKVVKVTIRYAKST